jgi:dihydropteroate synthase
MSQREHQLRLAEPRTWPHRPLIAGIVNVTPDSFSDGGDHFHWEKAVAHGLDLAREGADMLDVGGESTRPGAAPVSVQEELDRVLPVVRVLTGEISTPISIDTRRPEVAGAALAAGASWVNDIGGLRDPAMAEQIAAAEAGVIIMHMQGEPASMQDDPKYDDVVEEVSTYLAAAAQRAVDAGIERDRVWVDPGIGFGKTLEHNLLLLESLGRLGQLGFPVMLGASRKRFIGDLSEDPVHERVAGGLAAAGCALQLRHAVVRTHDVAATRQYLLVRRSIESGEVGRWERNESLATREMRG